MVGEFQREREREIDEARTKMLMSERQFTIRQTCRLCDGNIRRVLTLPDTPLANEYPAEVMLGGQDTFPLFLTQCVDCQHVQLPVVVDPDRMFRDYAYRSGTSRIFREHLRKFAEDVQPAQNAYCKVCFCKEGTTRVTRGLHPGGFGYMYNCSCGLYYTRDTAPTGLVVEIGSNDGTLLAQYRKLGFKALGVDPARNLVDAANAGGDDTIPEFFGVAVARDILAKHGPADLIVANNVFAHADDLKGITQGVAELLSARGRFVFEVGYLPDMIERGIYRTIYHEHLSFHHVKALSAFFDRFALTLFDAHRVPTQGGSIRCFLGPKDEKYTPGVWSDRAHELSELETPAALDASRLATNIANDKARIRRKLDELRADGRTVCGYGAPAQLTTTMYALGLTRQDVDFIVDDNPAKVGRSTPGLFVPIVGTGELYARKPDACIIFSANFADDIRERHAGYEGEWVVI